MKLTRLLALALLLLTPCTIQAQWLDWSKERLEEVTTSNCKWDLSDDIYFEQGQSMRVKYKDGASITFPYNYPTQSLSRDAYMVVTLYNPSKSHTNDRFTIEFLYQGESLTKWGITTRRTGWNSYRVRQYNGKPVAAYYDEELPLKGRIPAKVDQICITMPDHSGEVYLGRVLLCNWKTYNDELKLMLGDQYHPVIEDKIVPPTPQSVSKGQLTQIKQIGSRLDETFGVLAEAEVKSLPSSVRKDLEARYKKHEITRNGEVVNGSNLMQYLEKTGWNTNYNQYGKLALDVAVWYRNTESKEDKEWLKKIYYDLFDYGVFVDGLFNYWSNGYCFTSSIFIMRDELAATDRINDEVLYDMRMTVGYDKIFIDYSFYHDHYREFRRDRNSKPRPPFKGEKGEDIDYMRIASVRLLIAALLNSDPREQVRDLKAVSHYFSDIAMQYSPAMLDGFKEDGTLNHHWGWIDGYGVDALHKLSFIVYALSHSDFRISEQAFGNLYKQLVSQQMRSLKGILPSHLTGKGGEFYSYGGRSIEPIDRYAFMALSGADNGASSEIDPYMSQTFIRLYDNLKESTAIPATPFEQRSYKAFKKAGIKANEEMSGHQTYSQGLAMIHRRDNWLAAMKAAGRYSYMRESGDPFIAFVRYGFVEILRDTWNRNGIVKHSSDFGKPGFDWRFIPYATTIDVADIQSIVNKEYKRYWPNTTYVGGVTQGDDGLFSLEIVGSKRSGLGSVHANKSYFCFDNYIVCVGSNIANTLNAPTVTTLFQDAVTINDEIRYSNSSEAILSGYNNCEVLNTSAWVTDSNLQGYWIPSGAKFNLKRGKQTNRNWANKTNVSGDFALAYLDNGVSPKAASYWYISAIDTTPKEMGEFNKKMNSKNPPFELLANSDALHAVKSADRYAMAIIDPTKPINIANIESVNRPSMLMLKSNTDDSQTITVADPDLDYDNPTNSDDNEMWSYSKPHKLTVTLKGAFTLKEPSEGVSVENPTHGVTKVTYTVRNGLSFSATLINK